MTLLAYSQQFSICANLAEGLIFRKRKQSQVLRSEYALRETLEARGLVPNFVRKGRPELRRSRVMKSRLVVQSWKCHRIKLDRLSSMNYAVALSDMSSTWRLHTWDHWKGLDIWWNRWVEIRTLFAFLSLSLFLSVFSTPGK